MEFFVIVLLFQLKCLLSGHEMPITVHAVQTYVNGKKYKKLLDSATYSNEQYKQFLQPAKKRSKQYVAFMMTVVEL